MASHAVLVDAYGRVRQIVHGVLDGISPDHLVFRVDAEANTIAWLVWHLTRVQDDHIADAARTAQVWTGEGWEERFGLPFPASATGYGQEATAVADVRVSAELLGGYHDAVLDRTLAYLDELAESDLDRIIDDSYDPPVRLGARLVSVISDSLQHAGQAAYVRGLAERR